MKQNFLPIVRLLSTVSRSLRVTKILLYDCGLACSFMKREALDKKGLPLPWLTYPAIEYLTQFDLSQRIIFEYGSGNSSLFWASRAKEVISIESDPIWFSKIRKSCPPNLRLLLATEEEEYISSIAREGNKFDLIVIDGKWRNNCMRICSSFLNDEGIIILDNSDRHYSEARNLRSCGFFQIDFTGFSPINAYTSTTSMFVRASSHLQLGFSEPDPIGGLGERAALTD
jgi:hypothetical protein